VSSPLRFAGVALLIISAAAGTLSRVAPRESPRMLGGYYVLAADFHVHTMPFSSATLTPWDTVDEARRQGLDVIAITPHNHTWVAKVGQWYSRRVGGPTVLVGEEIHTVRYHLLAIGIRNPVSWNLSAARAIDEIHRQGGVAIAAHPTMQYWAGYDSEAMGKLDGAEVVHPIAWQSEDLASELRQFYARAHLAAIGDSDYHGPGPLGVCRTYVFARDTSEQGILDAIRKGRTVVYDRGSVYGDSALIRLAGQDGRLPALASHTTEASGALSRITGILGLVALFVFGLGEK
jgi:predicted metal-dependent phosphoesterase TrpH